MSGSAPYTPEQMADYEAAIEMFRAIEGTKYLAIAASTILVYDILCTIDSEIKYIWASKWSFGRAIFHINRVWAVVVLSVYVPTLFMYNLSERTCIVVSAFYIYGSICSMGIITSILVVRVWLIFGKGWWFLAGLLGGCAAIMIPALVLIQISFSEQRIIPNPAPDLITACHFTSSSLTFVPYVASIGYETVIFSLTVYKTWRLSKEHVSTPLMTRLFRDGSCYYFVVLAAMAFTCFGSFNSRIASAAIGSGDLVAIMASMCSRLILSTRAFYDEANATHEFLECEMNTLPRISGSRAQNYRPGATHSRRSRNGGDSRVEISVSVAVEESNLDGEGGGMGAKTPKAGLTETRVGVYWPGEDVHRRIDVVEPRNPMQPV